MKKLLLASVALFGFAGVASAADLPVRTAPPAPIVAAVPIFTWTGFYVGVNAGYGWQDNNQNSVFVPAGTFAAPFAGASGVVAFGDESGDGFVGGGQIGYNYQFGSFVAGVEADLQWADLGADRGLATFPGTFPPSFVAAGTAGGIDWFGTVRARLGVAFDRALIYATGGFAYGGGDTNDEFNGIFFNNNGNNDVRTGWVLGAGMEYAFTNNLTAGIEGLWVNLNGDNNGTFVGSYVPAAGADRTAVFVPGADNDDDADFFVARAKLNFKFGTY
ncbi:MULTISPECIES: outer membrane protein [Microvirga]|uniref:outer membrane protein n=1 Tax=Microvirga TaxID=186650 RepID=UPI001CFD2D09|nr:porin family protein [Microvirga lenta]MCB5173796.1 porin family protein [Microvirga lenta]